jgi:hypothetical protein
MTADARSLVRTPQPVHGDAIAPRRLPHANVVDLLLDPITGIHQGARTVIARHSSMSTELREEVLGLIYERARELSHVLIAYDRRTGAPS